MSIDAHNDFNAGNRCCADDMYTNKKHGGDFYMKLLIAEDEDRMRDSLAELLRIEEYEVDTAEDGTKALEMIVSGDYDIVILDNMMPGMLGFEVAKRARESGIQTPILMLSAKSESHFKVKGLDSGADDYMAKPFMIEELLARLRALIRRTAKEKTVSFSFGDIELKPELKTVECTNGGKGVRLSDKEYQILEQMIASQGQLVTRDQLAKSIWGSDGEADYNNVEVYMTFTRKKLAFVNAKTKIKSVRGKGYKLRVEDV